MESFRFSVYAFESKELPDDLRLIEKVREAFVKNQSHGKDTWFECGSTMEQAAKQLDEFKANTCGSAVNVALINLNGCPTRFELEFLLNPSVLGDPPTIFTASLRSTQGESYHFAREKSERECEKIQATREFAAPSCIDSYSSNNRPESALRIAEVINAYLDDDVKREESKQRGLMLPPTTSPGFEALRKFNTIYYGARRGGKTGVRVNPGGTSVRLSSVTLR